MISMLPTLLVAIDEHTPHPDKMRMVELFAELDIPIEPSDFIDPTELELILKLDKKELMYRGAYLRVMVLALAIEGQIVAYHTDGGEQGCRSDLAFVSIELWESWIRLHPEVELCREWFNGQS